MTTEEFWADHIHDWPWCSVCVSMPAVVEDAEFNPFCGFHGLELLIIRTGQGAEGIVLDKLDEVDWLETYK